MKYYTLSFKNKILLALILVLTACIGVVFGSLFSENNSISASADLYAYSGNISDINSDTSGAHDWLSANGGAYYMVNAVTLVKFFDYNGNFKYGIYYNSYEANMNATQGDKIRESVSGYTIKDMSQHASTAATIHTGSNGANGHGTNVYHTTYFPHAATTEKEGTPAYFTGNGNSGVCLNFSYIANQLTNSNNTDYTYTVRTCSSLTSSGSPIWYKTTSCDNINQVAAYTPYNSYIGVRGGLGQMLSDEADENKYTYYSGQIQDPTDSWSDTGCYVKSDAVSPSGAANQITLSRLYNIRVVEVRAVPRIINVKYNFGVDLSPDGNKVESEYRGMGSKWTPTDVWNNSIDDDYPGWEFIGWSTSQTEFNNVTYVQTKSVSGSTYTFALTLDGTTSKTVTGSVLYLYAWYEKTATFTWYQCGHYPGWYGKYYNTETQTLYTHKSDKNFTVTMPSVMTTTAYPNAVGWYDTTTGGTLYSQNTSYSFSTAKNYVFYASISRTITATFEKNGATSIGETSKTGEAKVIADGGGGYSGESEATIQLPSITRDGWNILGWNTSSSATSGTAVGSYVSISSNTTYYAITSRTVVYRFYQVNESTATEVSHTFYNTETEYETTAPTVSAKTISGYYFSDIVGWGSSNTATSALRVWE